MSMPRRFRPTRRGLLAGALFLAGVWSVPHRWCSRDGASWYRGDPGRIETLSAGVAHWVESDLGRESFSTGSALFDGEWLFGSYQMAGLALGQMALERPALAPRHRPLLDRCLDALVSPPVREFDRRMWQEDPLESLDGPRGHAAYLGYMGMVLGLARLLDPAHPRADLHDRVVAALTRRLEASPFLLLETYPHELYPVDNAAVIATLALHDRATGGDHRALIDRWTRRIRDRYLDPATGLLHQSVHPADGHPLDKPRGSGSALASYFLSFTGDRLSADLYASIRAHLSRRILGFDSVLEYPGTVEAGWGDIDSGPLILGSSISATGFTMGAARAHGDPTTYQGLFGTAYLFGVPVTREGRFSWVTGGPLGDCIMAAMLTAGPPAPGRSTGAVTRDPGPQFPATAGAGRPR